LSLKLQVYIQAKQNIDDNLADSFVDPVTKLHTRAGLARRARELGALMVRMHGAFASLVFGFENEIAASRGGAVVAASARISDRGRRGRGLGAGGVSGVATLHPAAA
jgi:hypothetical protein